MASSLPTPSPIETQPSMTDLVSDHSSRLLRSSLQTPSLICGVNAAKFVLASISIHCIGTGISTSLVAAQYQPRKQFSSSEIGDSNDKEFHAHSRRHNLHIK